MVRPGMIGGLLALAVWTPALASPDWQRAGGAIFAAAPGPEPADGEPIVARLPATNQPFADAVDAAAAQHRIDPKLLHALVTVESAYRPAALSPAGAAGLTQLMPETAQGLGVADRFDPADNLSGGAEYLARQLLRFGDLRLALAAYNAGPGRVARLGRVPEIAETRLYVDRVVDCFLALSAGRTVRSAADCREVGR